MSERAPIHSHLSPDVLGIAPFYYFLATLVKFIEMNEREFENLLLLRNSDPSEDIRKEAAKMLEDSVREGH